jgi:hypothetical protein
MLTNAHLLTPMLSPPRGVEQRADERLCLSMGDAAEIAVYFSGPGSPGVLSSSSTFDDASEYRFDQVVKLADYLPNSSGSFALFAAILRASSLLSNLAADLRPGPRQRLAGPKDTAPIRKNKTHSSRPALLSGARILCSHRKTGRRSIASVLRQHIRSAGR